MGSNPTPSAIERYKVNAKKWGRVSNRFLRTPLCAEVVLLDNTNPKNEMRLVKVELFLGCRSLELSLKGNLSLKGLSINTIKKTYGHDLSKMCEKADLRILEKTENIRLIKYINDFYKDKTLEYRHIGYKEWPHPKGVYYLAQKVYEETERKFRDNKNNMDSSLRSE